MSKHGSKHSEFNEELGDFTTTIRVIPISIMAAVIGFISAYVAWALLRLIGFFTNVFYYGRTGTAMISPAGNHLGWWAILIPVAGGIVIGFMARYGSDRIRGHGIPEALESILINGSKVEPRVAVLKPLSAAISIGSGGPFGAEGPIIVTGGAIGSIVAQLFHLTAAERKTLLVAGAAAGMAATFATPVAAVLLAVELLLFEWKPRSVIPVALACATAGAARRYILGLGPLFPVPAHPIFIGPQGLIGCVIAGLIAGAGAWLLTQGVYATEDFFKKLPVHWMWWPAIGGIAVGIGGLIFPQALGVGYDTIGSLLQGDQPMALIAGVLLVKSAIWVISLGSGTSGGILAPLLMIGAALGGVEGMFLPHEGAGFWPLVSMAGMLGGAMSAPFTAVLFALELTHDINMLLPLMVGTMFSYGLTVLVLKRSILTEKVARRGFHITREYSTDPMEILFVREVMRTKVVAIPAGTPLSELKSTLVRDPKQRGQHLYPVVDADKKLRGVVTRNELRDLMESSAPGSLKDALKQPVVAQTDEPLRAVVVRMAETGLTRMPVVERETGELAGMVSLADLLRGRLRTVTEERQRERVLELRLPFGSWAKTGRER
ncbi:MAG TPA: chloride channel protein [Bryobacteraceae bacterium]|jgi:H+/Cl- antiporter ClcA/CBS domain-containing protein|nr:chloride channel protein [Bryobacteraceae bacterium]